LSPHAPTADIQLNAKRPLGFAGEPGWCGGKADMWTAEVRFLASAGSPFSSKAVVYEHILSSLISLMFSVDVKYHVYLLTYLHTLFCHFAPYSEGKIMRP